MVTMLLPRTFIERFVGIRRIEQLLEDIDTAIDMGDVIGAKHLYRKVEKAYLSMSSENKKKIAGKCMKVHQKIISGGDTQMLAAEETGAITVVPAGEPAFISTGIDGFDELIEKG